MIKTKHVGEVLFNAFVAGAAAADNAVAAFKVPFNCRLKAINAKVVAAGVTGSMIVDVNKNGTTIFATATKLTFGATVDPTYDTFAATPTLFSKGDVLSVDIDSVHTTPAEGLMLTFVLERQKVSGATTPETGTVGVDSE